MGHTRMTTQGSAKKNYNNHPFFGCVKGKRFALAHNGVLWNDRGLRHTKHLPKTKIQTDSYVAVQLLNSKKPSTLTALQRWRNRSRALFHLRCWMSRDALWIVKGGQPAQHCLLSGVWRLRLRLDCRDPEQSVDPMRQTTWGTEGRLKWRWEMS